MIETWWQSIFEISIHVEQTGGVLKPFNDIIGMILTFSESLAGISWLAAGISYIAGVLLIARGTFKIRVMADHRSQMFQPMEIAGPMVNIVMGVGLIWWPVLIDVTTYTFWGTSSPLSYDPGFGSEWDEVWVVILDVMKLVGFIAFIKGWYYMTKMGEQGAQGMFGKGITHIIGGILAYHMGPTIRVLMATFGFEW